MVRMEAGSAVAWLHSMWTKVAGPLRVPGSPGVSRIPGLGPHFSHLFLWNDQGTPNKAAEGATGEHLKERRHHQMEEEGPPDGTKTWTLGQQDTGCPGLPCGSVLHAWGTCCTPTAHPALWPPSVTPSHTQGVRVASAQMWTNVCLVVQQAPSCVRAGPLTLQCD